MADRYWVGGTASWDATAGTKWATTSGGAGGSAVPGASDDVFFDAASGAVTVTVAAGTATCKNLDFTGFTGTFAGTGTLSIRGNTTLAAGMTRTYTGPINIAGGVTQTLTTNGKALASTITVAAASTTLSLSDALNNGTAQILVNIGTFLTNNNTVTCGTFASATSNACVITLGSSTINCVTWTLTGSSITLNAGTSTIQSTNRTIIFNGGGKTYYNVILSPTGTPVTMTMNGANTFNDLTLTAPANKTTQISLSADITVNGTLTLAGNSAINRILVYSSVTGTPRTITAAALSLSGVDFMDITGAGAASWNLAAITYLSGDCGGNSGITFTTAAAQTWNGGTGNWSTAARWTSRVPLPQDSVIFDSGSFTAGSQTVTADMPRACTDFTITGVTNSPTFNIGSLAKTFFGSFAWDSSTFTITGGAVSHQMMGRGSHTILTSGKAVGCALSFSGGGTYTLSDDLTTGAGTGITVVYGTFDANDKNLSIGSLSRAAGLTATTEIYMGSGTWSLISTGGTQVNFLSVTGLTVYPETSKLLVGAGGGSSAITIRTLGVTLNDIEIYSSYSGTVTFIHGGTFNDFIATGSAKSLIFTAGTTITVSAWSVEGSAGNVITINSTTTTNFTLSKASGTVNTDYLSIANSDAGGGATWYAGPNSTDAGGGNTGWIFTAAVFSTTKPMQYVIDGPHSITESSQYTVKASASVTKSSQYCVVTTPTAPTLQLQYEIAASTAISITDQLQYCVVSPVAPTKSLQYTVTAPASVTKSLQYTIDYATALTKSLQYAVVPSVAITQQLAYTVITSASVTLGMQYTVGIPSSYTKQAQYAVITEASVTESLSYAVKTEASLTKQLQYSVWVPGSYTKQAQYAVVVPASVTEPLTYAVVIEQSVTKSLQYAVGLPGSYTKDLQYCVTVGVALDLPLSYLVTIQNAVTLAAQYAIAGPTAITKPMVYTVVAGAAITKALAYSVITTHAAITKAMTYDVQTSSYPYHKMTTLPYSSATGPYTRVTAPYTAIPR